MIYQANRLRATLAPKDPPEVHQLNGEVYVLTLVDTVDQVETPCEVYLGKVDGTRDEVVVTLLRKVGGR